MTYSKMNNSTDIAKGIYSYLKNNKYEEFLPEIVKILGSYKEAESEVTISTAVQLNEVKIEKAKKLAERLIKKKWLAV